MADASFDITTDTSGGLLKITFSGQWTPATLSDFRVALTAAYRRLEAGGFPSGSFFILSDARMHGVQSKEIIVALEDLAEEFAVISRKNAVIVSSVLHKMQVQRLATSDKIQIFMDENKAIAWLRD